MIYSRGKGGDRRKGDSWVAVEMGESHPKKVKLSFLANDFADNFAMTIFHIYGRKSILEKKMSYWNQVLTRAQYINPVINCGPL